MAEPANGNQRATIAVAVNEIAHLRDDVLAFRDESREWRKVHDEQCRLDRERIAALEMRASVHEERMRQTTGVLAALQVVIGAVAAWLGIKLS